MNDVFKRYEKKYLLSRKKYKKLMEKLLERMQMDQYGKHTISNIYFDTNNYELIRHSLEKPAYKEKLRLRAYGTPTNEKEAFIEIKKKFDGIVYKRRVAMPLHQANRYLYEGVFPNLPANDFNKTQIFQEIDYMNKRYSLEPKAFIAYDRIALFGKEDHEVRVTFDENIRGRNMDLDLRNPRKDYSITNENQFLMEVKIAGAMPMWMVEIFTELEIQNTSFSKYGEYYKEVLRFEKGLEVLQNTNVHLYSHEMANHNQNTINHANVFQNNPMLLKEHVA